MSTELIVVALLAVTVATFAVWRPKWVWAPVAALVAFIAYLFGSRPDDQVESQESNPKPTESAPDHVPEDRSETMVEIARDDDVSADLDNQLDSLDSDHESWRNKWLR